MLRLQNKPLNPDTAEAVANITTFIGMLSDYYQKDRNGELKIDE